MPIRAEDRWLYPIDWQQISETVRFGRASSRCEQCGRPHMTRVAHLGDGRWWDALVSGWRNSRGRRVTAKGFALAAVRTTYVVLACAHLNHDPADSSPTNLRALCQRCHLLHDAAEHRWRRWWNAFKLRALRDLYEDPRLTRERAGSRLVVEATSLHLVGSQVGKQPHAARQIVDLNDGSVGLFDQQPQSGSARMIQHDRCIDVRQG